MDIEKQNLFSRWVVIPFTALRQIPDGDGAFAALAMGFGLYERWIASSIHRRNGDIDKERYVEASNDFAGAVSPENFKAFWEMYRVGVQHYFHPKHFTKGSDGTRWGWDISEEKGYSAFPTVKKEADDLFVIAINPWAFVEHTITRWVEHPDLLDELSATKFGNIQPAVVQMGHVDLRVPSALSAGGSGICPPRL